MVYFLHRPARKSFMHQSILAGSMQPITELQISVLIVIYSPLAFGARPM
jgi:hypothetical protein